MRAIAQEIINPPKLDNLKSVKYGVDSEKDAIITKVSQVIR